MSKLDDNLATNEVFIVDKDLNQRGESMIALIKK